MISLISHHPILTSLLVGRLELQSAQSDADMSIYEGADVRLFDLPSELPISALTPEHLAGSERIFVVSYAFGVSNERCVGDIVLPNAFLALHPELRHAEVSESNTDEFFYDSLFLTQYEDQKDYDFGKMSLSIGGIMVCGDAEVHSDAGLLEKIRIAYEPDCYDTTSLRTVRHLQAISGREDVYVIAWLLTGEQPTEWAITDPERQVGENIVNITKFFIDDFVEGEGKFTLDIA